MTRDMEYEYEVYVDKSWMAGGSAASPADALGEADHYALMYDQRWRCTGLFLHEANH